MELRKNYQILRPGLSHGHRSPRARPAARSWYSELRCIPPTCCKFQGGDLPLFCTVSAATVPNNRFGDGVPWATSCTFASKASGIWRGSRKCAISASHVALNPESPAFRTHFAFVRHNIFPIDQFRLLAVERAAARTHYCKSNRVLLSMWHHLPS